MKIIEGLTRGTIALTMLVAAGLASAAMHGEARRPLLAVASARSLDSNYNLIHSMKVSMTLSGTTPIKNWRMKATQLTGTAKMSVTSDSRLERIESLGFTLPVHALEGDEPKMDEAAYESLKAERYPNIVFTLISATIETLGSATTIRALGTLSVAGVTRVVTLNMHMAITAEGAVVFAGAQPLKMSDYNVERPSILFGAIKAGDDIQLSYHLIFIK